MAVLEDEQEGVVVELGGVGVRCWVEGGCERK